MRNVTNLCTGDVREVYVSDRFAVSSSHSVNWKITETCGGTILVTDKLFNYSLKQLHGLSKRLVKLSTNALIRVLSAGFQRWLDSSSWDLLPFVLKNRVHMPCRSPSGLSHRLSSWNAPVQSRNSTRFVRLLLSLRWTGHRLSRRCSVILFRRRSQPWFPDDLSIIRLCFLCIGTWLNTCP